MHARPRKLCVLGRAAAGKTSVALRLAGCDPGDGRGGGGWRLIALASDAEGARPIRLFDGPGRSTLDSLGQTMLLHAEGWLLVADAAEPDAPVALASMHAAACRLIGPRPALVVLNKSDLAAPGSAQVERLSALAPVYTVSARTGHGIEALRAATLRLD